MDATRGTGIEKDLFPSTVITTSFFDTSYYYIATMKHTITRYVLYGGLKDKNE